jgi:DNA-binding HxlR family transcriptional regulator
MRVAKDGATYSVLSPGCPSRLVLDRIADKWTAIIIQILARGALRYSALQRQIGDISQKVLTQTLRSLERDGLVRRKVHPDAAPRVEYSLTPLGHTLLEPLQTLCRWTEKHLAELEAHRRTNNSPTLTPTHNATPPNPGEIRSKSRS